MSKVKLVLDDFQGDFDPLIFLGQFTEGKDGDQFDPDALKYVFANALEDLLRLRAQASDGLEQISKRSVNDDHLYRERISNHTSMRNDLIRNFSSLDRRFTRVATAATKIGDRLESLDSQRTRAQKANTLIKYYLDLAKEDSAAEGELVYELDNLDTSTMAKALVDLKEVVSGLKQSSPVRVRDILDQRLHSLQHVLLKRFETAQQGGDIESMRHCAESLVCVGLHESLHQR